MACSSNILSGLAAGCTPSMGGILEVYINHRDKVTGVTVASGSDAGAGKITAITLLESGSAPVEKFHKYEFKRNTANATSTYNIDPANGVNFVTTDLNLIFNRQETTKRIEITALALDDLAIIYKDANGAYWYMGKDEPVQATAASGETGTARADGNKYSITLQDNSLNLPYEILVGTGGVDLSQIVE